MRCQKCCRTNCICKPKCYSKCDPCDPCGKCSKCCGSSYSYNYSKCSSSRPCNSCYKCCGSSYKGRCCPQNPCGNCNSCCSNGYNPWVPTPCNPCNTSSCYPNNYCSPSSCNNVSVPSGTNPSDYLYWESNCWKVGSNQIRLGANAGANSQSTYAVAVGANAGTNSQSTYAVAVGYQAGQTSQGSNAVAVGANAASSGQGANAVALGYQAAGASQGANAIAIGANAVSTSQTAGSIVLSTVNTVNNVTSKGILLNASNNAIPLNQVGFFAAPVRTITSSGTSTNSLYYDPTANEILYDSGKTFVINHPLEKERYLVHACLEGPESGVYYRGESETKLSDGRFVSEVTLPSYVTSFADNFTVHATPINTLSNICCSRVNENGNFNVETSLPCFFSYVVFGRRGIVNVEPKKKDVRVFGDGPYKYIQ